MARIEYPDGAFGCIMSIPEVLKEINKAMDIHIVGEVPIFKAIHFGTREQLEVIPTFEDRLNKLETQISEYIPISSKRIILPKEETFSITENEIRDNILGKLEL